MSTVLSKSVPAKYTVVRSAELASCACFARWEIRERTLKVIAAICAEVITIITIYISSTYTYISSSSSSSSSSLSSWDELSTVVIITVTSTITIVIIIIIVVITDEYSTAILFDLVLAEDTFYAVAFTNLPNDQWAFQFSVPKTTPTTKGGALPEADDIRLPTKAFLSRIDMSTWFIN